MRHLRVHIGPEAIFARLNLLPEAHRLLGRELEPHDRLDGLEAILPRHSQPQRRAELLRQRLAVNAGHQEGQLIGRFGQCQPFRIGPRIPGLLLPGCHARLQEGLHLEIARRRSGLGHRHQRRQREAGPRHGHRPRFHAAVPVDSLLKRHPGNQLIHVDGERAFHVALDLDPPRPRLQRLCRARDALVRAELVEIVVGGRHVFIRQRTVDGDVRVLRIGKQLCGLGGQLRLAVAAGCRLRRLAAAGHAQHRGPGNARPRMAQE